MTRMSREFTLVLLGSGILSAGYFAAPEPAEALAAKSEEQAEERVHGTHNHGYSPLLFVHGSSYSGNAMGRPGSAMAGITRGGIGAMGRSAGAGG